MLGTAAALLAAGAAAAATLDDVKASGSLKCGVNTGLAGHDLAISASGAVVYYVRETQKEDAAHLTGISYYQPNDYLILDPPTVRNLELVEALDGSRSRTLVGMLDETVTGMGSRLLKQWLLRMPLD